jgi:hypothetical protein
VIACLALACVLVAGPAAALAQDEGTDLRAMFPASVEGAALAVEVFDGAAWLGRQDPATEDGALVARRTEELVGAVGKGIGDLTVATALHQPSPGNHAAITAMRVAGAAAAELVRPAIALLLGDVSSPTLRVRAMAGRDVVRVTDAALPGSYPRTIYPAGDTVWVIEAEQPVLEEILVALPDIAEESWVDPAPVLVDEMPDELFGQRRAQVSVSSSWSGLLTTEPGAMFGPEHEDVAVDLFLSEGITLEDLSSIFGVWDTEADASAFVVGFHVDGGDAALMARLRDEVIVPSISQTAQQPTVGERTVAGRDVRVLTDQAIEAAARAQETYHFVAGEDVVWMINLARADEEALVEVIGALPA